MAEENIFNFEDLLQENGKTTKDLPTDIKHKIQGIKLSLGKLTEDSPQEKHDNIAKQDDAICAMIEAWLNNQSAPPAPVVNTTQQPTAEEIEAKQKAEAEALKEKERIAKENGEKAEAERLAKEAEAQTQALSQQEQQVKDALRSNSRIAKATLAQILGREPSSVEKIGNIKVKEYFLNRQVYIEA
jgi:hypothetical protein